ncbi:MAG: four helix bundle protein [Patescibacteria group bacterium]|jgi:four helix bundle protein|nr:four helix bundle protein [Patescibacteria group bacterium]
MTYHEKLRIRMDEYAHLVYGFTKNFPKDEIYGITSQLRRSSLSVVLNYIEGYARRKGDNCKVYKNFLEISYGSLKESKYLLHFCLVEKYLQKSDYEKALVLSEEIGAMVYKIIK